MILFQQNAPYCFSRKFERNRQTNAEYHTKIGFVNILHKKISTMHSLISAFSRLVYRYILAECLHLISINRIYFYKRAQIVARLNQIVIDSCRLYYKTKIKLQSDK